MLIMDDDECSHGWWMSLKKNEELLPILCCSKRSNTVRLMSGWMMMKVDTWMMDEFDKELGSFNVTVFQYTQEISKIDG